MKFSMMILMLLFRKEWKNLISLYWECGWLKNDLQHECYLHKIIYLQIGLEVVLFSFKCIALIKIYDVLFTITYTYKQGNRKSNSYIIGVTCHRERISEINSPYPSVFELTGPKDREIWTKVNSSQPVEQSNESRSEWRSKATHTPWPMIGWTEKGMQVTLVAWPEEIVGEEKKTK